MKYLLLFAGGWMVVAMLCRAILELRGRSVGQHVVVA
jgi:hypothetical protein